MFNTILFIEYVNKITKVRINIVLWLLLILRLMLHWVKTNGCV